MNMRRWLWLLLCVVTTAVTACKPLKKEPADTPAMTPMPATATATIVPSQPAASPTPPPTNTPPPKPTPAPTIDPRLSWPRIGGQSQGVAIAIPPTWVNLSGDLDVASATNRLGLITLLAADSPRAGRSLLAGKDSGSGAFMAGLVANFPPQADTPMTTLLDAVNQLGDVVSPIGSPQPLPGQAGAFMDVNGDPAGFFAAGGEALRTRIILLAPDTAAAEEEALFYFLFSAPAEEWQAHDDTFSQMASTARTFDVTNGYLIGEGGANARAKVRGIIHDAEAIHSGLEIGADDVWVFHSDHAQYATITLTPDEAELDVVLSVITPSGQMVTNLDVGYAGSAEVVNDLLLEEAGTYVIQAGEFYQKPGRYTLTLALADESSDEQRRVIKPGQGIQSILPAGDQHFWTFDGTAGHLVSIVVAPDNDQFDAILDLYGPDGSSLAAMDEGFSGDAEVIAGYELPVTGEYTIRIRSFAANGGMYTLSLDEGGERTENFFDAGDLAYGDVRREALRSGEAHAWFFQGRPGDEVTVVVSTLAEPLDLDLWLLDPDIERVAAEDRFGEGKKETIELALPKLGQYLVLVRDFFGRAGEYEISLTAVPAQTPEYAGFLRYGEAVEGTLAPGQQVAWQFRGDIGDVIDISLQPADGVSDLIFILQDPEGVPVLEVDRELAGAGESQLAFTITADGRWGIVVKEFYGSAAAYTLTAQRSR